MEMKDYKDRRPPARQQADAPEGLIYGRNGVRELLKSGREIDKIMIRRGEREGSINVIVAEAAARGIPVVYVEKEKLDSLCRGGVHQGVAAFAAEKAYCSTDDILDIAVQRGEKSFIVILDGVEDPHNLGAIIRSAECAGAHGVIIPKRRASGLTSTVSKASAGALEHIAVAKVTNLAAEVDRLKEKGVWIYSAEAGGDSIYEVDLDRPAAFILGSEGGGVSRLLKEKSDFTVSIPLHGKINSLNVSAAAAVVLFEAAHRRTVQ